MAWGLRRWDRRSRVLPGSRWRRWPSRRPSTGRDVLRVGLGSLLLVDAGFLVRAALGGTPGEFEQLITTGTLVVLAGTVATLAGSARADGTGGFGFSLEGRGRRHREPDAHPLD